MASRILGHADQSAASLLSLSTQDQTDRHLLERFVKGHDEVAFEALVQRHGPMVLSVCHRVLDHAQDAEDAFQATFLVFMRKAHTIGKPELLGNWLYGVAYRVAHKARTQTARRRQTEREAVPMPAADPLVEVAWRDFRAVLDEELQRLPARYRAPLVLCYLEGLTNEEAARQLGWPTGSMSYRLARGRKLLRERLATRHPALPAALFSTYLAGTSIVTQVPTRLVDAMVSAASLSAHELAAAGTVSPAATALAEGALRSMSTARRVGITLVIVAGTALGLATSAGYAALTGGGLGGPSATVGDSSDADGNQGGGRSCH
jgi:RNA polymerase sigma factor (sigma-70 family)